MPDTAPTPANDDDLQAVFGENREASPESVPAARRTPTFAPWHRPVKQVVRSEQWKALTNRLLEETPPEDKIFRYFTLPGADLLDVRVLAECCIKHGVQVQYFGFDSTASNTRHLGIEDITTSASSALLHAGRITADSEVIKGRLEDIADVRTHAYTQLRKRRPFHAINIDVCDHLAYSPPGQANSTFQALNRLLEHQLDADTPWLLLITTRVDPTVLETAPIIRFQKAISDNLLNEAQEFKIALAEALGSELGRVGAASITAWTEQNENFLRIYTIGLGKYLLTSCLGQPNFPARVQLASVYAYRVHDDSPDMLAIAFRVSPEGRRFLPPGSDLRPRSEPAWAAQLVRQSLKLQDLDNALDRDENLRETAFSETRDLLKEANYDIDAWERWVIGRTR